MSFGAFGSGGGGNSSLFGQSQPTFGVSAFGASANTGSSLFGSSAPATGAAAAFGAPSAFGQAAPPAGTGLFGSAQQSSAFGQAAQPAGTGLFGAAQQSSGFGQAGNTSAFAGTPQGAFGTPGPSAQPAGFGQTPQAGFGQPSAFGAATPSAFGQQAQASQSPFAAAAAGAGAAGFGAQSSGAFGSAAAAANPAQNGTRARPYSSTSDYSNGDGRDGEYVAITMIPFFQGKSFEELRAEDYALGDFGGPAPAQAGGGIFGGSTTPAATGFGQQQQQQQQLTPGGGLFGSAASAPPQGTGIFGSGAAAPAQATGLFGAAASAAAQGTGLFGAAAQSTSGFGASAAQSGSSLFGSQQQSAPSLFGSGGATTGAAAAFGAPAATGAAGAFGAPAATGAAGAFGTPAATGAAGAFGTPAATGAAGAFGTPAAAGTGLFGSAAAPAQPQTSLFGQSGGGSLFGGAGNAQASGSSLFGGASTPSTGLFGAQSASALGSGTVPAGTGLFGAAGLGSKPAAAGFGGAGGAAGGSSLFGGGAQSGGSLFGASQPALGASSGIGLFGGSSLFGASSGSGLGASSGSAFGTGLGFGSGLGSAFGSQPAAAAAPQALMASVNENPFGNSQLYAHAELELQKAGVDANGVKQGASAKPTVVVGQMRPPSSLALTRATGARPPGAVVAARRALGSDLFRSSASGNGTHFLMGAAPRQHARFAESGRPKKSLTPWRTPQQAHRAATIKKLVIEPLSVASEKSSVADIPNSTAAARPAEAAPPVTTALNANASHARGSLRFEKGVAIMPPEPAVEHPEANGFDSREPEEAEVDYAHPRRDPDVMKPTPRHLVGQARDADGTAQVYSQYADYHRANLASPRARRALERAKRREAEEEEAAEPSPPFTKRLDIETRPPLAELAELSAVELRSVRDFAVIRQGLGEVCWSGETDVTGIDIDRMVDIRFREIRVYPDEADCPPVGKGLNKRAVVLLHGIWKKDRSTRMPMKDARAAENMVTRLKAHCEKNGLRFIGYKVETGTWSFEAEHF